MRKIQLIWYLLTIIPLALLFIGYLYPSQFFNNQEAIRDFIGKFGILAPIAFIFLQIIQVVLTPISHYTVSIAGGFIFGTWYGFLYNWIGRVIGTLIAFYLGRKFGRRIIRYFVKSETLKRYDLIFNKGKVLLFLAYFLPLFPDDEISYLAGFSAMKPKVFIPLMILGHISGSLALAYTGSGLSFKEPLFITISLITFIGGVFFVMYYRRISKPQNSPQKP
ncbi:MAG: TVP38/TMEM64 family protein [archaeon]